MNKIKCIGLMMGLMGVMMVSLVGCHQKKAETDEVKVDTVIFEKMEVVEYEEDELWADENVWEEEDIWADEEPSK